MLRRRMKGRTKLEATNLKKTDKDMKTEKKHGMIYKNRKLNNMKTLDDSKQLG